LSSTQETNPKKWQISIDLPTIMSGVFGIAAVLEIAHNPNLLSLPIGSPVKEVATMASGFVATPLVVKAGIGVVFGAYDVSRKIFKRAAKSITTSSERVKDTNTYRKAKERGQNIRTSLHKIKPFGGLLSPKR